MTRYIPIILLLLSMMTSCAKSSNPDEKNGIYYWRTTLSLNDAERKFIESHNVRKMYVRFFDVNMNYYSYSIIPEATLQFRDSLPAGVEVIPTVYITTNAIDHMQLHEKEIAEKIYKRIVAMCRRYNIDFKEIQLDCDWSKHNRDYFFKLCEEMKNCLDTTQTVSSTIRLHQLTQTPPPVEKGVLMVYNTGNLMELTTENSIFSVKDIAPYLRDNRLENYNLPLDIAYPAYGWSVVYSPGNDRHYFHRLLHNTDFSDVPGLKKVGENTYVATENIKLNPESSRVDLYEGYKVRVERPSAKEILRVKEMIESHLKNKPHNNILYHLDETQLSNYTANELDKIYTIR